jgi:hypothetical protein
LTPERARKLIRKLAGEGRYEITLYCQRRMLDRRVTFREVRTVLVHAARCYAQANGRWRLEAEDLTLIVGLIDGVVVVTLFRGDEDESEDAED